jgi:hypothetical protein
MILVLLYYQEVETKRRVTAVICQTLNYKED